MQTLGEPRECCTARISLLIVIDEIDEPATRADHESLIMQKPKSATFEGNPVRDGNLGQRVVILFG
jgi:hypothetical protein